MWNKPVSIQTAGRWGGAGGGVNNNNGPELMNKLREKFAGTQNKKLSNSS